MSHKEKQFFDIEEIKTLLATRIDDFVLTLFPNAKKEASCYRIGNLDGEAGRSMLISTRTNNPGYYMDSATGDKGKAWNLVAAKHGLSVAESIAWLARFLGIQPIESFGSIKRSENPADLAKSIVGLTQRSIDYAKGRGISEETLRAYGVGSSKHQDGTCFPYYDAFGDLGRIKHWGHKPKPDGKKDTWVKGNVTALFGKDVCSIEKKIDRLVICEGEFDAMSCFELGIPAVSIPMGCSNMDWITNDYQYLSYFDEIVVMFDNDDAGKKAAKDVIARLGAERCMNVTLPLKDANEMLVKGRGDELKQIIANAAKEPIAEIIDPNELKAGVKSCLRNEHINDGDPFFLVNFDITFRKHEVTLWFGYSHMGKSQAVQNLAANLAARGKASCIASFEQPPEVTLAQVFTSFTADPNFVDNDEFELAYSHLTGLVYMYKSMDRADPKHLISTFIHAHKRYGVDSFIIDNVMTMAVDRGDNTAQATTMDMLRMFVARYPVHLNLVAHPRKPPESMAKPPGMTEIRGASEWGDMPNNIITVWKDTAKSERIEEMIAANFTEEEIHKFWQSTPCGKFLVRKQRATGRTPMTDFWFHLDTRRFMKQPGRPHPFYSEIPWARKTDVEPVDDDPF